VETDLFACILEAGTASSSVSDVGWKSLLIVAALLPWDLIFLIEDNRGGGIGTRLALLVFFFISRRLLSESETNVALEDELDV